jgi:hypothetical protein
MVMVSPGENGVTVLVGTAMSFGVGLAASVSPHGALFCGLPLASCAAHEAGFSSWKCALVAGAAKVAKAAALAASVPVKR